MSAVSTEQILVVPTALFHQIGHFQGFSADADRYLTVLLAAENTSYRPRGEMEDDPSFKQLIPYVIFRHRDAEGRESIFCYTRGKGQGEKRLHRKRSVGIGGHISTLDSGNSTGLHPYEEGMQRELDEEVEIATRYTARRVGLINDDQTEVGRVHLGIVHIFDVESPAVSPREPDIAEPGFVPVEQILADLSTFETWSQICLQALFGPNRG